jgi:hypothetical protein
MLILGGNSAPAGTYPDEQGKTIAWLLGALYVSAASDYAKRRGYEAVVLDVPGQPQSQDSPQAKAALKQFSEDQAVCAFYGFSGGGYNVRHILERLASNTPDALHRIDLNRVFLKKMQPNPSVAVTRRMSGSIACAQNSPCTRLCLARLAENLPSIKSKLQLIVSLRGRSVT